MAGGRGDDPVKTVRRCFEAWDRNDLEGVLTEYAYEVEVDASRVAEPDEDRRGRATRTPPDLDHAVIAISDRERSNAFYRDPEGSLLELMSYG